MGTIELDSKVKELRELRRMAVYQNHHQPPLHPRMRKAACQNADQST